MRYAMKTYGNAPDLDPELAAEAYVADTSRLVAGG
jgi:hypothetical protein